MSNKINEIPGINAAQYNFETLVGKPNEYAREGVERTLISPDDTPYTVDSPSQPTGSEKLYYEGELASRFFYRSDDYYSADGDTIVSSMSVDYLAKGKLVGSDGRLDYEAAFLDAGRVYAFVDLDGDGDVDLRATENDDGTTNLEFDFDGDLVADLSRSDNDIGTFNIFPDEMRDLKAEFLREQKFYNEFVAPQSGEQDE